MADRTYPVVEVFGPTVQGEGPHAGRVVSFVRLGGCDFDCSWCDSPHAVKPDLVKQAERLTAPEIVERLPDTQTVILSGGNPALHHATDLANYLIFSGRDFHVETQGTIWRDWLADATLLVVSPKPPSSGMAGAARDRLPVFLSHWREHASGPDLVLKFVVADQTDLDWALAVRDEVDEDHELPLYLSALTPPDAPLGDVAASYQNLCELVLANGVAQRHEPVLLPQLHVIAWGHARGV